MFKSKTERKVIRVSSETIPVPSEIPKILSIRQLQTRSPHIEGKPMLFPKGKSENNFLNSVWVCIGISSVYKLLGLNIGAQCLLIIDNLLSLTYIFKLHKT